MYRSLILTAILTSVWTYAQTAEAEEPVLINRESPDCGTERCKDHAVVFLHGLTGSRETWKNAETGFYWPSEIASSSETDMYDVYTINYESYFLNDSPSVLDVNNHVVPHMRKLASRGYKSIALIGHSLGGLVAARYINFVKQRFGHEALNMHRLVITLGTPNKGSRLADFYTYITRNQTGRILRPYKTNDYLGLLNEGILATTQKHEDSGCPSLRFFAAYETKPITVAPSWAPDFMGSWLSSPVLVVEKASATNGAYACQSFQFDHNLISKPAGKDSPLFKSVQKLLNRCAQGHRGVCPPPPASLENCGRAWEGLGEFRPTTCNLESWDAAFSN